MYPTTLARTAFDSKVHVFAQRQRCDGIQLVLDVHARGVDLPEVQAVGRRGRRGTGGACVMGCLSCRVSTGKLQVSSAACYTMVDRH